MRKRDLFPFDFASWYLSWSDIACVIHIVHINRILYYAKEMRDHDPYFSFPFDSSNLNGAINPPSP